jgi:hypothetical protein
VRVRTWMRVYVWGARARRHVHVSELVALLIQHQTRMRYIVLFVACVVPPHFSTLSHKRYDFRKRRLLNIKCGLICSTILSEKFLILRRTQRDIVINVKMSSCKVPVILVIF